MSVILTLKEGVDVVPIIFKLVSAISSKTTAQPKLRIQALIAILNLVSNSHLQYSTIAGFQSLRISCQFSSHVFPPHIYFLSCIVLLAIFDYAIASNQSRLVFHFHKSVEAWVVMWELTVAEKRALYHQTYRILTSVQQKSQAVRFLTLYFGTFRGETELPQGEASVAEAALISAINSPVSDFRDRSYLLEVGYALFYFCPLAFCWP